MKQPKATSDEELELKHLLRQYRVARDAAQPHLDEMDKLREEIKFLTIATGIQTDVQDLHTVIVNGHIRKSWISDKLMALAEGYPLILACRKETQVQRTVRIKNGERKKE